MHGNAKSFAELSDTQLFILIPHEMAMKYKLIENHGLDLSKYLSLDISKLHIINVLNCFLCKCGIQHRYQ